MSGPFLLFLRFALALSLYAFLGWALLTLWRGLQVQTAILTARKVPAINLTFQGKAVSPLTRRFTQGEIVIGRDSNCEVTIQDETVSARHARLLFHHGQWWLEDLGSTNGTQLNQERLSIPTVVISGDEIGCGQTTLTVSLSTDVLNPPTRQT